METRIERKIVTSTEGADEDDDFDIDHDAVGRLNSTRISCGTNLETVQCNVLFCVQELAKAIFEVTDMNPDYSVEKIEIETKTTAE